MSSQVDRKQAGPPIPLRLLVLVAIVAIVVVTVAGRRQRAAAGTAQAASTHDHRNGHKEDLVPRKRMLTMAIGALENDWTRKAVIAGLKIARDRM